MMPSLICAPLDRLDEDVAAMRAAMAEASPDRARRLRAGHRCVHHPVADRYMDEPRPRHVGPGHWGCLTEIDVRQTA